MSDITTYPLEDNFETTLSQQLTASATALTAYVNAVPAFSFPASVKVYFTINPGKSNEETILVENYSSAAKTLTITSGGRAQGRYNGDAHTPQTHNPGSIVIISDPFKVWDAIKTAINSKIDNDTDDTVAANTTWGITTKVGVILNSLTTVQRDALASAPNGAAIYNTTLGQIQYREAGSWVTNASGGSVALASNGVAGKVDIASQTELQNATGTDATSGGLNVIPVSETVVLSSGAGDFGRLPRLNSSGKLAVGFVTAAPLATYISDVTSTKTEIDQVCDGVSANVTATNLNTTHGGAASNADALHTHSIDTLTSTMYVKYNEASGGMGAAGATTLTFDLKLPSGKKPSGVSVIYTVPDNIAAADVAYQLSQDYGTPSAGGGAWTNGGTSALPTFTVPASAAGIQEINSQALTLSAGAFSNPANGDYMRFTLLRDGAHASDTYSQSIVVRHIVITLT